MLTRACLAIVVVATSLMIGLCSPAWAQGEPSLTIEPGTVEAPGEQSLVVGGKGWTSSVVYILPCEVPGPGAQVDSGTCDTGAATPVSPTDGSFTFTKTFDVPAEGLALGAGDTAQTEFAAFIVTRPRAAHPGGAPMRAVSVRCESAGRDEPVVWHP